MARVGRDRPAPGRRYAWLWRRVRVALFLVLTLSIGLRLLQGHLRPDWAGWPAVRHATGTAFVLGLLAYAAYAAWRARRNRTGRR